MNKKARILRIEKISPNDGHGLRTVVFFKGCPMRCKWCSTPESQLNRFELYYRQSKCLQCGKCVDACPEKALKMGSDGVIVDYQMKHCVNCHKCAQVCPVSALSVYGKNMSVAEVMKQIRQDEIFYYHSGGGVTLSGGDVLQQADFAAEVLKECKSDGLHTMAEMNMFGSYDAVEKLLSYLNEVYIDLKHMDPMKHKEWTGVDNTKILDNIKKLCAYYKEKGRTNAVHFRTPLIAGINDSKENIRQTALFCERNGCADLEFLPYHRLGETTYAYLGRTYAFEGMKQMKPEEVLEKVRFLKELCPNLTIRISGKRI
ncbi:MAG: glycyl-radical enzyme activating protein [Lachnospiraceae bacterium]|nr:glycyl-radical enzyme activating protein [Lachnospiraceae bacterium]